MFTMSRKNLKELFTDERLYFIDQFKVEIKDNASNKRYNTSLINYRDPHERIKRYDLRYSKGQWMIKRLNLKCVIDAWSGAR